MTEYICKTAREEFNTDHASSHLPWVRTANARIFGTLADVEFLVTSVRGKGSLYPHWITPAPRFQCQGHTWNLLWAAGFPSSLSDNPRFSSLYLHFSSQQLRKVPVRLLTQLSRQCPAALKPFPLPAACSSASSHCPPKAGWCLAPGSLPEGAAGFIHSAMRAVNGCPT